MLASSKEGFEVTKEILSKEQKREVEAKNDDKETTKGSEKENANLFEKSSEVEV